MCNTWLQAAELLDFNVHISTPPGYEVEPERANLYGNDHFKVFADPMDAAKGADLVPPLTYGPAWVLKRKMKSVCATSQIGKWMVT